MKIKPILLAATILFQGVAPAQTPTPPQLTYDRLFNQLGACEARHGLDSEYIQTLLAKNKELQAEVDRLRKQDKPDSRNPSR